MADRPSKAAFERGRWDVPYWSEVYLGIRFHKGQKRMAEAYLRRTESRWRALYFWICVAAGNRAGKTMALAVIILHSCVFRMGLEPPDLTDEFAVKHWLTMPYNWWHFAVQQAPSEQVFKEIILMLGGQHRAQKYGCPWALQVGEGDAVAGARRIALATETEGVPWCNGLKERGEYAQIILAPEFGGAHIHFRSTKASALSAIGQDMNGLSFDEAGLETNLDYLLNEIMHARRLGTGGQFIIISTASVATSTDFQDLWYKGDPEDPFREKRRFSMRMSSRENIGYGLDQETFDAMIEGMPEDWISQNIEGEFVQSKTAWFHQPSVDACFHDDMPENEEPKSGRVYLHSLDPGLKDKCWSLVFRITKDRRAIGVSIERQAGKQTTRGIIAMGVRDHRRYGIWNPAWKRNGRPEFAAEIETGVDTTALGGHMFRDLITEEIEITSVEFGGNLKAKRQMISDLKTALDEGRIIMPSEGWWREVRNQLRNYKLLDRKQEQDLVMGLAIIAKLLRTVSVEQGAALTEASKFEFGVVAPKDAEAVVQMKITSRSLRQKQTREREARRALVEAPVRLTPLQRLNAKRALVQEALANDD
jgi:hypothetical protein